MIQIDWQSRTPIYDQLIRGVVRLKALGVLQPGEKLPSVRSLAGRLGVNPNTVQKAYQMLEAQGVIYSVSGKGSFLSERQGASDELLLAAEDRVRKAMTEAAQTGVQKKRVLMIADEVFVRQGGLDGGDPAGAEEASAGPGKSTARRSGEREAQA